MIKKFPIFRKVLVSLMLISVVLISSTFITRYVHNSLRTIGWKALAAEAKDVDRQLAEKLNAIRAAASGQVNMLSSDTDLKTKIVEKKIKYIQDNNLLTKLRLYLPDGYTVTEHGAFVDASDKVNYNSISSFRPIRSAPHEDPFNEGHYIIETYIPVRKNEKIVAVFSAVLDLKDLPTLVNSKAYNGSITYSITDHKTGTVFVDTKLNKVWNINDVSPKSDARGYSWTQFHKDISNGIESQCAFYGRSRNNMFYGYTIPSQVDNWNIAVFANEKDVMKTSTDIMNVVWIVFGIEVLALLIYFCWQFIDTKKQYKIIEEAAQKKQLEKQQKVLEESLSLAKSANNAKTVFLNNMSHDIRTPMNAIIGYTNLALSHIDQKARVLDYLFKINQSSEHLLSLINDVLDMSRIESGKMFLDEKPENLTNIINELENIINADINKKRLNFFIEGFDIQNDDIICDKLRLHQILINILSNSIKYTPEGGHISFKIHQKSEPKLSYSSYEFSIKDNGIGMNKEFLEHIFEPFSRFRSSTVSGIQGTGLGMAITKNLVDLMGGQIEVHSEEKVGTEVILHFTFKLQDKGSDKIEPTVENINVFKGKKVLIVEDNDMNLEIASELLQEEGCIISSARNGKVAVELVQNSEPGNFDMILMDILMPVMDGYEATRQIRALENKKLANIPIVAMTANAFDEDRKKALECGMNEHVPKPVNITTLKQIVSKII